MAVGRTNARIELIVGIPDMPIPEIGFVPSAWDEDGLIVAGRWYGTAIPSGAFAGYSSSEGGFRMLRILKCGEVTSIGVRAFQDCSSLTIVEFPLATSIEGHAFHNCSSLTTIIFRSTTLCTLANVHTFHGTPIFTSTGYIYVPAALLSSYKSATNWITYANQIRAIEDYPEITGG